jgi:hypothetical protein
MHEVRELPPGQGREVAVARDVALIGRAVLEDREAAVLVTDVAVGIGVAKTKPLSRGLRKPPPGRGRCAVSMVQR